MKIAVLGTGSAGITSVCHLCAWLPAGVEIHSIHDPNIPIIGVGESSTPFFVQTLEFAVDFNLLTDLHHLDATLKHSTRFTNWRHTEFDNPLFGGNSAIHFNNFKLKDFVFSRLTTKWPDKFKEIHRNVVNLTQDKQKVYVETTQDILEYDYVMDARGFPKNYDNYFTSKSTPVNSAIVYNKNTPGDWNYTKHIAHENGWMFGLPLQDRQSYGYLYNSNITNEKDAHIDMQKILNANFKIEDCARYNFKSFYAKKVFEGRIIKNGNRALFFEPLSALSLYLYFLINRLFTDYIKKDTTQKDLNFNFLEIADAVDSVIAFIYHGGSKYDSKFWQQTVEKTNKVLVNNEKFLEIKQNLQENFVKQTPYNAKSWIFDPKSLYILDHYLGYNYFST